MSTVLIVGNGEWGTERSTQTGRKEQDICARRSSLPEGRGQNRVLAGFKLWSTPAGTTHLVRRATYHFVRRYQTNATGSAETYDSHDRSALATNRPRLSGDLCHWHRPNRAISPNQQHARRTRNSHSPGAVTGLYECWAKAKI